MFNNECVGELAFEATAPAIALAAFFVTFLLDFFGARYFHTQEGTETPRSLEKSSTPESPDLLATNMRAMEEHGHSHGHGFEVVGKDQHWQVMILEVGIIFHSIMIGVTLGAGELLLAALARYTSADNFWLVFPGGGEGWSTLLIVIVFHQFFEGLALGARIALLDYSWRWSPWIMGLAFTLITPIGIAIGVGVHENFSANGKAPLLAVGILNSISAGILVGLGTLTLHAT
jgi:zinc transporter 1/2/3